MCAAGVFLTTAHHIGRIGRDAAEADYHEHVAPIIEASQLNVLYSGSDGQAHPTVFPPGADCFDLDSYHLQGSRILSRSFTTSSGHVLESDSVLNDEQDSDGESQAIMIPYADMLNAEHGSSNARLFANDNDDEDTAFSAKPGFLMKTTSGVKGGSEIVSEGHATSSYLGQRGAQTRAQSISSVSLIRSSTLMTHHRIVNFSGNMAMWTSYTSRPS